MDVNDNNPIKAISQPQRVVFFAICKFLAEIPQVPPHDLGTRLKRWLRVVWNLVSVETEDGRLVIRTIDEMRKTIRIIDKFKSQNIYAFLRSCKLDNDEWKSFGQESLLMLQLQEEIEKAKKILFDEPSSDLRCYDGDQFDDDKWEGVIAKAENFAFFRGTIRFLFTDAGGNVDWKDFDLKIENSKKYFQEKGVNESFRTSLTKALVLTCSQWGSQLYNKQIFNTSAIGWKHILCSNDWRKSIHNILSSPTLPVVRTDDIDEVNSRIYVQPILSLFPYEWIVKNWPEGRIRWNHGRLGFYPPNAREAIVFDWDDFRRNYFLSNTAGNVKVASSNIIEGTNNFFMGWDIIFAYRDENTHGVFQWTTTNIVYLLHDDLHYVRRNAYREGQDDINNFYCFSVKSEWDIERFKMELKNLIEQSEQANAQQS